MSPLSEKVRTFLGSIGVADPAIEEGLKRIEEPRVLQDVLYRVIAHAKAKGVTGEKTYNETVRVLQALAKGGASFATKAAPLLSSAANALPSLKAACEADVIRWEWWTGNPYPLAPFFNERHRFSVGKKVVAPTNDTKKACAGLHAFGFDAGGRLRVERRYNEIGHDSTFFAHVTEDGASRVEARHYSYSREEPINAQLLLLADGRPAELHFEAKAAQHVERYRWDGDRIGRISVDRSGAPPQELDLSFDALGALERITDVSALDAQFHRAIFERPKKGLSLAKLLPAIASHFLERLEAELRARKFERPLYALALVIDGEAYDHLLPPRVAVATVDERMAFVGQHGGRAVDYLFSPVEWIDEGFDIWDERMMALVEPANHLLWSQQKYDRAMKLANELARTLNGLDLPVPKDPDFVVFACELDGQSGADGVHQAAPLAVRKRLTAARLLSPRAPRKARA